jgi:phosphatidylglycerol:prolipoprotein diacylglycerol transferase
LPLVIDVSFSPILFTLGPLSVGWYGLAYVAALAVGLLVAGRHLASRGLSENEYSDLAFWAIVVGLLGARLYYDAQSGFGYYLTNPQHLLAAWEGGMAYFGAIWTVPVFLFLYCRWRGLPLWLAADAAALFAAAGQPIGRLGNVVNGDVVGYPSDLPWAMAYTNPASLAPRLGVSYQPAAVYELLIGLGILGILLAVRGRLHPRPGALFFLYLLLYAVSQFGVFFLRANSVTFLGLKQAQLSSLALLVLLVPAAIYWRRSPVDLLASGSSEAPETVAEDLDDHPAGAPSEQPGASGGGPDEASGPRRTDGALLVATALVALIGVGVSIYLTAVHFAAAPLACTTGSVVNCERVLSSAYSVVLGTNVPTSAAGILWFVCSGALAAARLARPGARLVARAHLAWSVIGLVTVLLLVFIEIVRLGTICLWCSAAHGLVLVTFVLVALGAGRGPRLEEGQEPAEGEAEADAPEAEAEEPREAEAEAPAEAEAEAEEPAELRSPEAEEKA